MKFAAIAIATFGLIGSAQAADLLVKKSPPAPVVASATCLDKNSISNDTFGFTAGSDVNDVGALSLSGTYGLSTGTRSGYSYANSGTVQATYSPYLCVEVDPYVFAGVTNSKSFGFKSNGSNYGAGVEAKYKLLGRETHGIGLTFDFIAQGASTNGSFYGPPGFRSDSSWDGAISLFADKEIIAGKVFAAFNAGYDWNFADIPGPRSGYANTSIGRLQASVVYQVIDGLFVGIEGSHYRRYNNNGFGKEMGYASYLGPNFYWSFTKGWAFSGALAVQVQGHTDRAFSTGVGGDLDVNNFSHYIAKLKLNHDF